MRSSHTPPSESGWSTCPGSEGEESAVGLSMGYLIAAVNAIGDEDCSTAQPPGALDKQPADCLTVAVDSSRRHVSLPSFQQLLDNIGDTPAPQAQSATYDANNGPVAKPPRRRPAKRAARSNKKYTNEQIHFCLYYFYDKKHSWIDTLNFYQRTFGVDDSRTAPGIQGVVYRANKEGVPVLDTNGDLVFDELDECITVSVDVRHRDKKIGLIDRYPDLCLDYSWVYPKDKQAVFEIGMRHKMQRAAADKRKRARLSLPSPTPSPRMMTR